MSILLGQGCIVPDQGLLGTYINRLYSVDQDGDIYAIDDNGSTYSVAWSILDITGDGTQVSNMAVGKGDDLYFCNLGSGYDTIYKYKQTKDSATQVWTYDFTEATNGIRAMRSDKDGALYVSAYDAGSDQILIKLVENSSGVPQREWTYTWTGADNSGTCLAIDKNGYIALGTEGKEVHLIDPDGDNVWTHTANITLTGNNEKWIRDVNFDSEGNVYAVQEYQTGFIKLNRAGTRQYTYETNLGFRMFGFGVSANNTFYLSGWDGNVLALQENESGTLVEKWEHQVTSATGFDGLTHQVAVRPDNSAMYVCAYGTGNRGVYKVNEDGAGDPQTVWHFDTPSKDVRQVRYHYEFQGNVPILF